MSWRNLDIRKSSFFKRKSAETINVENIKQASEQIRSWPKSKIKNMKSTLSEPDVTHPVKKVSAVYPRPRVKWEPPPMPDELPKGKSQ